MDDYKYPYIPKEYYPAVMYACSCIRKYGTFNVACNSAAKKYDVDVDTIKKYVRERQGAGQKGLTRKYKYYACISGATDRWENYIDGYKGVYKATNDRNAMLQHARYLEKQGLDICGFKYQVFENEEEANLYINDAGSCL